MHTASFIPHRPTVRRQTLALGFLLFGAACIQEAQAGMVVGFIADRNGQAVQDAVLYATPVDAPVPPPKGVPPAIVAQENHNFAPYVTVIRPGTLVRFPNRDPHDHHLKSFSPAKTFELRVYNKREEPTPIAFETAGEVALVCHLHDWMRGYIFVVDTPYTAKTDKAGNALLKDLPAGKYEIKAWAPTMLVPPSPQVVQVTAEGSASLKFQLNYVPKPAPAPRSVSTYKYENPPSY